MSGSTWDWIGPQTGGSPDDGSNWSLSAGPGNAKHTPQAGDTIVVNDATIALDVDATLNSNTLFLTGTTTLDFTGDITGSTVISIGNPSLDGRTVISNDPLPPADTTLNFDGYNINEGTLVSNGGAGSSLTINVNQNGPAPGFFLNYGVIAADTGNTVTIAVNGTSELFNAGLVYANGGTVVFDGGTGIAGGYAPMLGDLALVGGGGTLELNAGYPSGTKGSNPVFAFYDRVSGDTLKLDQIKQFGGRILGFQQGDTIDLGSALSIGTIAVTGDGQVLLESNTGSVIATLVLSSGNYTPGNYAVTTVAAGTLVAGGFTLTTGGDGNTLLTTDVVDSVWNVASSGTWQQAAGWSTGVVPGANDTAVIGVAPTTSATGTISPFVLTTGSVAVDVGALIEAGNSTTLQITSATTVGLDNIAYGIQQVAGEIEVTNGKTLTTTFLRQLGPGADLQLDTGAALDITGHSNLGFANNGTLTETTVVNGTTFANGDTIGLLLTGTATVDGGLINAGPVTNTSNGTLISTGGLIAIGEDGGGTPARMTVQNGGTVIDTAGLLSSDPTSFGSLTLTGPGTTWNDAGDPTDLLNSRGYMLVGYDNQYTNQPSPAPSGTAQLLVQDGATLNEATYAIIGDSLDSAGSATIAAGSVWNIGTTGAAGGPGGFMNVGRVGSGTLVIAGGTVNVLAGTGSLVSNGTTSFTGQGVGIARDVGSEGTVIVDGGQFNITVNNTIVGSGLGVGGEGHGVLDIFDGGTVSVTNGGFSTGSDSTTGDGTITVGSGDGQGALLEVSSTNPNGGGASIGKLGTGTMYVNAGGTVDLAAGSFNVGRSAGSYGFVKINGGLLKETSGGLNVGDAGTGTLDLLNLGTISLNGGGVVVGESLGGQGLLAISSGGMLTSATNGMDVGEFAGSVGTLEVLAGGIYNISTHGISVGLSAGAVGTIVVDGSGAQINIASESGSYGLEVGQAGTGYLTVESNGRISDAGAGFQVGQSAGATGTVVVDTGGVIAITGAHGITVGNSGSGQMTIGAGGTVSAANYFDIAQSSTAATGNVVVNGGTLDDNGIFNVGTAGAGTLTVEGGGVVHQTGINFYVGGSAGSHGTVVVDGGTLIGSTLFVSDTATNATGSVTVGSGGLVEVGAIAEGGGGAITVGGAAAAELSASGLVDIGQNGSGALLTIKGFGTVTGTGGNTLEVLSNGTVGVNGGTLGGFGAVDIGGASGGTLDVARGGTLEGANVSVGSGGMLQAGSLTIDNAITQGGIETLSVGTGGTVLVSTITLGAGGVINLNGGELDPITMDVTGPGTIGGSGTLDANISFASGAGSLIYDGGGTLEITGAVSGGGTLGLGSGAIQLDTAPGSTPTVTYGPGTETLILAGPTIDTTSGGPNIFTAMIRCRGSATRSTSAAASPHRSDLPTRTPVIGGENVTLDVTQGVTNGFITLNDVQFAGGATKFNIVTDGSNGDAAIQAAPCYAAGTRIATVRGEIAVEDLQVGDLVQTVLGEASVPIIWIGRRDVDCARHPKARQVWPVRVTAGAFGPGRPHTDLLLSPDHAVYVNDVLIPIQHLINDTTIGQIPVDRITYYHVELPQHDVVLAEGLPAESYLDMRDGSNYANRAGPTRLYPDFSARMWEAFGCAPLIVTGPELMAARALVGGFTSERDAA